MQNHKFAHIFEEADAHMRGTGRCAIHDSICSVPTGSSQAPLDWVFAGLSCHPVTPIRKNNDSSGNAPRMGKASEHPDYDLLMLTFPSYLEAHKVGGFCFEEVDSILKKDVHGVRHIDLIIQKCEAKGYSCRALLIDACRWLKWPRSRLSGRGTICH
jgi:hypothetical protein